MPDAPRSPNVTPAFLAPFVSARFEVDHLAYASGAALWPAIATPAVPGAVAAWTLHAAGETHALTVDAFRILQAAKALPDGGFVVGVDVHTAGGVVPAGTMGRLVSKAEPPDGAAKSAACRYAVVEMVLEAKKPAAVAPPPPPPVSAETIADV